MYGSEGIPELVESFSLKSGKTEGGLDPAMEQEKRVGFGEGAMRVKEGDAGGQGKGHEGEEEGGSMDRSCAMEA